MLVLRLRESRCEVDSDLAGETVVLWWGLFNNELYVEYKEQRYGPYLPVGDQFLFIATAT